MAPTHSQPSMTTGQGKSSTKDTDQCIPGIDSDLTPQSESSSSDSDSDYDNDNGTNPGNKDMQARDDGDDGDDSGKQLGDNGFEADNRGGGNNEEEEDQLASSEDNGDGGQVQDDEDSEDEGAIPIPKGPMFVVRKSHNPVPHAFRSKEANIARKEKAKNRAKLVSPYL